MAPILPGLSDRPEQLEEVVREARAAGARSIWANVLYLRPGTREHFLEALAEDWPEEVARYEQLFANRAYLPSATVKSIIEPVRKAKAEGVSPRRRPVTRPEPKQLALAV
jgi:DNA repair photolyase